ncbi:MAG: 1-deoxy-D-xylulose-5-phosphate synthase [bacterium]|nr:1-deoxy-D-xylulose-5-phosphate synthase [bacterium]
MKYLSEIKSPADLKKLSIEELTEVAAEMRTEIIGSVSETGGHLATNLGSVELTLALHYLYEIGHDKLIWDVSNQTYGHKILTGRRQQMSTLRQYKGLAGFAKRAESRYDDFGAGHASTSISAALGFAAARDRAGEDHHVIAVIGDGAMTGGLAYEGLNNAGHLKSNLLVILNDNSWSISKNVGALSKYLTSITSDEKFNRLRDEVWEMTGRFKRRDKIRDTMARVETSIKSLLVPGTFFQKLGFRYFGPLDGHDMPLLLRTLNNIQGLTGPVLLHVATTKGKGYDPAEGNPTKYHGVGKFDKLSGKLPGVAAGLPSYTQVFGDTMVEIGKKHEDVVAISAAMAPGTGLVEFSEKYPERFYDVGIAEGHAATFAAGMAAGGSKPFLVVYSTFMQRAFDMVAHDIALQHLPVVICMDRAGLVGNDGPTHHGAFDLTFMSTIPDMVVAAPKDGNELRSMLHHTVAAEMPGPVAIRYPRDKVPTAMTAEIQPIEWGKWEWLNRELEIVLIATGTMVATALNVAEMLAEKKMTVGVINARFVKPLDCAMLDQLTASSKLIVSLEENALRGGMGQAIAGYLTDHAFEGRFKSLGIPDQWVTHGTRMDLLKEIGLDERSIADSVQKLIIESTRSAGSFLRRLRFRKGDAPESGELMTSETTDRTDKPE